jgi:16S rRNA processing protein RimM
MSSPIEWVLLARILRPQGRKGEVLADLFTDFPERFGSRPAVWLAPNGFTERQEVSTSAPETAEIVAHWLPVGRNAGRVVLQFSGVDSISAAEQLSGKEVIVPAEARMPLEDGAAYISDLVDCTVYDRGEPIGKVTDVQFATTPDGTRRLEEATPLLVIDAPDSSEVLVPFAKAYLVELDMESKTIRMELPEGLAEVNRPGVE